MAPAFITFQKHSNYKNWFKSNKPEMQKTEKSLKKLTYVEERYNTVKRGNITRYNHKNSSTTDCNKRY
jgi:hypothetical protein